jgi:hypothetical protein
MNPLVNPGAISATSMVTGATADEVWRRSSASTTTRRPAADVLQDVYKSESDTNQRNQAIGALMLAYGYIKTQLAAGGRSLHAAVLDRRQRARILAMMAATLAAGGTNPVTASRCSTPQGPGVLAVMATAGLYDDSGKWLYHTGLPAKSGVGGGIIAVSPASSASPSSRRRSTSAATAFGRSVRSRRSRMRSEETPTLSEGITDACGYGDHRAASGGDPRRVTAGDEHHARRRPTHRRHHAEERRSHHR